MRKPTVTCLSTVPIFVAALWLADLSSAAESIRMPRPPQTLSGAMAISNDVELEEVLVEGRRPETDTRKLRYWMDRLVGDFRYEGHVERLSSSGAELDRAEVKGGSSCVRFSSVAAVQCQLNVTWPDLRDREGAPVPGGVSSLTPALAVYSLEIRSKYVGYFNVDNDGVATGGKGWLLDDTLIARSPCTEFPGKCERVVRVEAPPDARVIRMRVDLERDGKVEVRYNFQWIRLAQEPLAEIVTASVPEPVVAPPVDGQVNAPVPPEVDAWLRHMVGKYRVTQNRACRYVRGPDKAAGCTESSADAAVAIKNGPAEAQCQGVGAGPGMRCVVHMEWPESGIAPDRWSRESTAQFMLYGFDPVQRGIVKLRLLPTVDTIGVSQLFEGGQLSDGELTFCSNQPCTIRGHIQFVPNEEWIRFVGVGLRIGDRSVQEAAAWRMYRLKEGASAEPRRGPENRSPRR
jgi:hypothetical protein